MKILICLFCLFSGFINQENRNIKQLSIEFTVELSDTIYKEQSNIPIILQIKNISSESQTLRNPSHWANSFPYLKQGEKEIPMIKIKVNPMHLMDTINIAGGKIYRTEFDYPLDRIVELNSLSSGEYKLFFQLQMKGNESLKSNVITFHKK